MNALPWPCSGSYQFPLLKPCRKLALGVFLHMVR
jgi:hypothetical protein